MIELFVLKGREALPSEPNSTDSERYDPIKQIWMDCKTGAPLVKVMSGQSQSSQFGETLLTESGEGVDCAEIAQFQASQFGETIMTKSHEGVDHTGQSPLASQFGETMLTATNEGVDTSEGSLNAHAPHSFF